METKLYVLTEEQLKDIVRVAKSPTNTSYNSNSNIDFYVDEFFKDYKSLPSPVVLPADLDIDEEFAINHSENVSGDYTYAKSLWYYSAKWMRDKILNQLPK